jgi:hypothetical protein
MVNLLFVKKSFKAGRKLSRYYASSSVDSEKRFDFVRTIAAAVSIYTQNFRTNSDETCAVKPQIVVCYHTERVL